MRSGVAMMALAVAAAACNSTSSSGEVSTPRPQVPVQAAGAPAEDKAPAPAERLLEDGVILLFEKVSLGNEPEANRRWRVDGDGTVWFSKNKPPVPEGEEFNLPLEKLKVVSAEVRDRLLAVAGEQGFWQAPERVGDDAVEDGMRLRLTIRDGDRERRIMADNIESPVIQAITAVLFENL